MSRVEIEEGAPGVRVIAFNRPEVRNAFDTAMYQAVTAALRAADSDEAVGAVVLTGRGSAFTSGQDLAEMAAIATGTAVEGAGQGFMGLLDCLVDLSVPLLAAVNGVAVGLGFTLLPHCNLVLVDAGARLRVPFAELGVPPEAASSVLFPALMGWQRAAQVLPHLGLGARPNWSSSAWPCGCATRAPCSTRRSPWRRASRPIPAPPPAPTRVPGAGGAARGRARGKPPRAGGLRHAARCRGRRRHAGRVRRPPSQRVLTVRLGITAALTDRDVAPAVLAAAVEELGFDSLFLPEHTHLPVGEDTPPALVGGVRLDDYKRCLDPLVALAVAAAVTTRIGLGTGILLAAQHEPILLAKQVGTLDHLSGGRVTLGVGFGWNRTEAEDHGVDCASPARGSPRAPGGHGGHWSAEQAEYHGEFVDFGPTWSWPKPVQQPRVRTLVGGGANEAVLAAVVGCADGWIPIGGSGLGAAIPQLHALAEPPARDPATLSVVPFGTIADGGKLEHYAGLGITEVVLHVRAGDERSVRAELESLAPLVPFAAKLEKP